jgi:2'-5' RNA ligase
MTAAAVRLRRLFFALWPADATREALRRETRTVVRHCGGKPVTPENYHVTLAFLGNVPDERLNAITTAAGALAVPAFDLTLDRYGWFDAAQVLWLGCADAPTPLRGLAAELRHLMAEIAELPTDLRPFHPHLTLARKVRNPPELKPPRPVGWAVDGFVLVESETEPDGARYQVIATFK